MKGKSLDKQMINEIDQFEKLFEDKIKEVSSKKECLECLNELQREYFLKSLIKDDKVVPRALNAFENSYNLARNRAIELGADVSKYSVTILGNNK